MYKNFYVAFKITVWPYEYRDLKVILAYLKKHSNIQRFSWNWSWFQTSLTPCRGGCDAQLYSDHEQEDSGSFQTVEKIKESCIKIEKHLKDDVLPKVASISSGLVEPQECMDELLRLKRVLMLADEHLMRHLEQLDTIVFEDTDFHGRLNKTLLLNRIQSVMDQFDTALVEINQLMQVYSS